MICDDRCRAPHDRHPVGIGGARNQNGAVDKPTNFLWTFDQADAPRHHGIANAQAREKATPFRFDAVGTQCTCFAAGLHGLRSCLHNEQLTRLAVFRPFHVHGPPIVLLDDAGPAGKLEDVIVVQDEPGALSSRGRDVACRTLASRCIDHLLGFLSELLLDDRRQRPLGQKRLEHLILIRIDRALNHVLAKTPGCVDQDDLVESGLGIDGEHDAGAAEIGPDHALDADRQRDLHMVEALGPPIADGAIGKERGVAAAARVQNRRLAANIQIALLLSGKACIGQVFGRGAGANSHIYIYMFFVRSILHVRSPAQLAIG